MPSCKRWTRRADKPIFDREGDVERTFVPQSAGTCSIRCFGKTSARGQGPARQATGASRRSSARIRFFRPVQELFSLAAASAEGSGGGSHVLPENHEAIIMQVEKTTTQMSIDV